MGEPLKTVTIVGGGTAVWLTAVMLRTLSEKSLKVQLIESPNIPTVGVGEATVPQMPMTLNMLKIPMHAVFRRCNASFKLGELFRDRSTDADGKLVNHLHAFGRPLQVAAWIVATTTRFLDRAQRWVRGAS
ncbi:tryptophan 7-halogenase [Primorskyibacter aestuariivivens]|uniref:tryptophan 7-halogenase n=1 Tax=Primorskyibacter aestuariivivens TaxID=1888912 RepID=UPI0023009B0B|nr:tryptophan 7-halogenase [Primorskyibacter aestuariivivens]MDA7430794.1 tryptophan 7-halogenase [Primorskyibacter aestuariivivens]